MACKKCRYHSCLRNGMWPNYVTENHWAHQRHHDAIHFTGKKLQERWKILKTRILEFFFEAIELNHYQENVRPIY